MSKESSKLQDKINKNAEAQLRNDLQVHFKGVLYFGQRAYSGASIADIIPPNQFGISEEARQALGGIRLDKFIDYLSNYIGKDQTERYQSKFLSDFLGQVEKMDHVDSFSDYLKALNQNLKSLMASPDPENEQWRSNVKDAADAIDNVIKQGPSEYFHPDDYPF